MKKLWIGVALILAMVVTSLFAQQVNRLEVRDGAGELIYVCEWYTNGEDGRWAPENVPCWDPSVFEDAMWTSYFIEEGGY